MSITDRIRDFIVTELGWRGGELADDYPLIENHVIDSLRLFQLVDFLETEYGVTIDDSELTPGRFATIKSIAELAENTKSSQSAEDGEVAIAADTGHRGGSPGRHGRELKQ